MTRLRIIIEKVNIVGRLKHLPSAAAITAAPATAPAAAAAPAAASYFLCCSLPMRLPAMVVGPCSAPAAATAAASLLLHSAADFCFCPCCFCCPSPNTVRFLLPLPLWLLILPLLCSSLYNVPHIYKTTLRDPDRLHIKVSNTVVHRNDDRFMNISRSRV